MDSFYDLIQRIQKRPSMYLGQASIMHLRSFLAGYILARRESKNPQTEKEKQFAEFQTWIQQKFNVSSSQSWDKVILFYSEDESSALILFFDLFDEFLRSFNQLEEHSLNSQSHATETSTNPSMAQR